VRRRVRWWWLRARDDRVLRTRRGCDL
jgi:hypothetical protein